MKGASARRARRRAISVLPTPVGPIMRMFLGVISARSLASTCWRRQRLRRAIATARLASNWPTMWLSSSETISWGVIVMSERLDGVIHVRVDAQLAGDGQRLAHDLLGAELGVLQQRLRGRLGIHAAGAD